jgi:hypothetical protein
MPVYHTDAGPSRIPSTTSSLSFPIPLPVSESPVSSHLSLASDTHRLSASRPASKMSSPLMHPTQPSIDDDEAFAQQLAEEEERAAAAAGSSNPRPEPSALPFPKPEVTPMPAPAPAPSPTSRKRHDVHRPQFSAVGAEPPLYHHVVSTAQTSVPTKTSPILPNNNPPIGRSSSASAIMPSSSRLSPVPGKDEKPNPGRSQSLDTGFTTGGSSSGVLSPLPTVEESLDPLSLQSPISPSAPVTPPPTANSFIDQRLLNGVCESFDPAQKRRGRF